MDESCLSPSSFRTPDTKDTVSLEPRDSANVLPRHAGLEDKNEDSTRVRKTQIRQLTASGGCIAHAKSHGISGGWATLGALKE
jgi:hypothetical protein